MQVPFQQGGVEAAFFHFGPQPLQHLFAGLSMEGQAGPFFRSVVGQGHREIICIEGEREDERSCDRASGVGLLPAVPGHIGVAVVLHVCQVCLSGHGNKLGGMMKRPDGFIQNGGIANADCLVARGYGVYVDNLCHRCCFLLSS